MKKLMIAAAAAAMIGAAFADAQVYDVSLSVKKTECKEGKFTQALENLGYFTKENNFLRDYAKSDKVFFRKKASATIKGVIWGCDCETIAKPAWRAMLAPSSKQLVSVGGYAFWLAKGTEYTPFAMPYTFFKWTLLNRMDQMKTIEGTWTLADQQSGESFYLMGAGFGTVTLASDAASTDCNEDYVKSMSGNFAGWMQMLGKYDLQKTGSGDGCVFCGGTSDTWELYECISMPFCLCVATDTRAISAAYGTWTIKYNSTNSKKLKKATYITDAVNFTSTKLAKVGEALDAMEVAVRDNINPYGDVYYYQDLPSAKQIELTAAKYFEELDEDDNGNILDKDILPADAKKQLGDAS